jgi:hypothetical protein
MSRALNLRRATEHQRQRKTAVAEKRLRLALANAREVQEWQLAFQQATLESFTQRSIENRWGALMMEAEAEDRARQAAARATQYWAWALASIIVTGVVEVGG